MSQESFDGKIQCSAKQSNAEEEVVTEKHVQSDLLEANFLVKTRWTDQDLSKMR